MMVRPRMADPRIDIVACVDALAAETHNIRRQLDMILVRLDTLTDAGSPLVAAARVEAEYIGGREAKE